VAVVIEGFTVLVRLDRIQARLSHPTFEIPNSTALFDDHLWRCAFMAQADARTFVQYLGKLGMKVEPGPDCEAVIVDEFDVANQPSCEWLNITKWEKAVIAWRAGTDLATVMAREGWDPQKGSGLTRVAVGNAEHLEFLGEKDGVETYLNTDIGKRVYIGRSKLSVDVMFERACQVIKSNFVDPGGSPVSGPVADSVSKAVSDLEQLLSLDPKSWNVLWFHGKGLVALGRPAEAYESFHRAFELEQGVEAVPRELAGVCLELGKFEEAVAVAERAAAISPADPATLGNLALAQLMAGQIANAKVSSSKALSIGPGDRINLFVRSVIDEVSSGKRGQPKALGDLTKPTKAKRPFWKFW
jgi:tetratricopeptide (TPR) repeat protein